MGLRAQESHYAYLYIGATRKNIFIFLPTPKQLSQSEIYARRNISSVYECCFRIPSRPSSIQFTFGCNFFVRTRNAQMKLLFMKVINIRTFIFT